MKKTNKLILEFSEFNLQRMNSDSVQASTHVDDPSLSTNAFDKAQDAIRLAMSRITDIMHNLKGTNTYKSLRSKLALEDQDVKDIKILRIVKSETLGYDIYLTFVIDEETYWGKLADIMSLNSKLSSEVFKDVDLYQPKEWIIKITGLITKAIKGNRNTPMVKKNKELNTMSKIRFRNLFSARSKGKCPTFTTGSNPILFM